MNYVVWVRFEKNIAAGGMLVIGESFGAAGIGQAVKNLAYEHELQKMLCVILSVLST